MTEQRNQKQIQELIDRSDRFLLLVDERIDGDTLGSTLAMYHHLIELGKVVRVFSPRPIPAAYAFLPGFSAIEYGTECFGDGADVVIIFDCADGVYIKECLPLMPKKAPLVVFDHHATNPMYGDVNQVIVDASSTGEVVWRHFKSQKIKITKPMAVCLLTAISTDTTIFSNPNTSRLCMDAAAELGLAGAKLSDIVRALYMDRSVAALKLWGVALERLVELPNAAVVTSITQKDLQETGASDEDLMGISNFLIGVVEAAPMICVLVERADGVKGSLRTIHGNVAELAQKYGGGGHVKAAGFTIFGARLVFIDGEWAVLKDDESVLKVREMF